MEPVFPGAPRVTVVLGAGAAGLRELLTLEHGELEVELGAPVEVTGTDPGSGHRLLLEVAGVSHAALRREGPRLVRGVAPDEGSAAAPLSLLRTLRRTGTDAVLARPVEDPAALAHHVAEELAATSPQPHLGPVDLDELADRHAPDVRSASDPVPVLQRWVGALGDAHTHVVDARRPLAPLPYPVHVAEHATLGPVDPGSALARSGVRCGDVLVSLDGLQLTPAVCADLRARLGGAPAHLSPWVTGWRVSKGTPGVDRVLRVRTSVGDTVEVAEAARWPPSPVRWSVLPSGAGYLRIDTFRTDDRETLEEGLSELPQDRLVVDLTRNVGGALVEAVRLRRRFLRGAGVLGSVRYTDGTGLSRAFDIADEPVRPYPGRVRFLTSPMTYSAAEDLLLGLQGTPHVEVWGLPSGGGSGRPRTVPLLEGVSLSVSTAVTYDRTGRPVEGRGIPVDRRLPFDEDLVAAADRDW